MTEAFRRLPLTVLAVTAVAAVAACTSTGSQAVGRVVVDVGSGIVISDLVRLDVVGNSGDVG
jgi:type IV pilus biogenesis protein CpaD/CtpE